MVRYFRGISALLILQGRDKAGGLRAEPREEGFLQFWELVASVQY